MESGISLPIECIPRRFASPKLTVQNSARTEINWRRWWAAMAIPPSLIKEGAGEITQHQSQIQNQRPNWIQNLSQRLINLRLKIRIQFLIPSRHQRLSRHQTRRQNHRQIHPLLYKERVGVR